MLSIFQHKSFHNPTGINAANKLLNNDFLTKDMIKTLIHATTIIFE